MVHQLGDVQMHERLCWRKSVWRIGGELGCTIHHSGKMIHCSEVDVDCSCPTITPNTTNARSFRPSLSLVQSACCAQASWNTHCAN